MDHKNIIKEMYFFKKLYLLILWNWTIKMLLSELFIMFINFYKYIPKTHLWNAIKIVHENWIIKILLKQFIFV